MWVVLLGACLCSTSALAQRPGRATSALQAARSQVEQGNYSAAAQLLEELLVRQPAAEAYLLLATCRFKLGEKAAAIAVAEQGLALEPTATRLAAFYVTLLEQAVSAEEAKTKLRAFAQRAPQQPVFRKALVRLLIHTEPAAATTEESLKQLVRDLPRDAEAHFLYGQWACLDGRDELCLTALSRSLALAPHNEAAQMQANTLMALAADRLNQPDRAEAAFRRALAANRRLAHPNPRAAFQYVDFLTRHGREAEAQALVAEILSFAPQFAPAWLAQAKWLARQQQLSEAIAAGKRALAYADGEAELLRAIHAFLAKTCFAAGLHEEAQLHQSWIEKQGRTP